MVERNLGVEEASEMKILLKSNENTTWRKSWNRIGI